MSDGERFVARWMRLKRRAKAKASIPPASETDATRSSGVAIQTESQAAAHTDTKPAVQSPELPSIDLSKLPPIESITAETDIRPFLAPGVPAELTRAALRRVWSEDPKIRDFIGIAENQWDFTDPNSIPGFGALGPLDDVCRLVAQAVGDECRESPSTADPPSEKPKKDTEPTGETPRGENVVAADPAYAPDQQRIVQRTEDNIAAQPSESKSKEAEFPNRRGHGGALPQ